MDGAVSGVLLAEKMNCALGRRWESFAGQNYFDSQGVFMAVLWSGPLLLISILIVVSKLLLLSPPSRRRHSFERLKEFTFLSSIFNISVPFYSYPLLTSVRS